jgi:Kef-type K+ transport system membrane component KefB
MDLPVLLTTLGVLLLVGLATDAIGRRTRLPRVTLLVLVGLVVGPAGFDVLPGAFQEWYEFLASVALTMVAFLLGGKLAVPELRGEGKLIFYVSLSVVVLTAALVSVGLIAFGAPIILALLLAGVATATDPAATQDVVRQENAKGPFTKALLGIVAVDDAWGLIAFSILLVLARAVAGDGGGTILAHGAWELGMALAVGAGVGIPAAFLTGRLQPGEPMLTEALGVVFLCAGLAIWLEASFLLAGMVAGAIVVNMASHHTRPFHEIEHIEWPFMILFFVLAGASLELEHLNGIGLIAVAYLVLRTVSRVLGGWLGGTLARAEPIQRRLIGFALLPQAGVAVGMALVAANYFPDLREALLAVTIGSVIVFEVVGPILTLLALRKTGEAD